MPHNLEKLLLLFFTLASIWVIYRDARDSRRRLECYDTAVHEMLDRYGDHHPQIYSVSNYLRERTKELMDDPERIREHESIALIELGCKLKGLTGSLQRRSDPSPYPGGVNEHYR